MEFGFGMVWSGQKWSRHETSTSKCVIQNSNHFRPRLDRDPKHQGLLPFISTAEAATGAQLFIVTKAEQGKFQRARGLDKDCSRSFKV
jgi:hypothetical protein